jgi:Cytochrome C oxidase, cbb3-type, subunit III
MREAAKNVVILTLFLAACGGERRTDTVAAGTSDSSTASDTAAAAQAPAPPADTARLADTTPAAAPAETAAAPKPAPKPAAKPAPKKPAAQAPAATAESTPPAAQPPAAQQPAPGAAAPGTDQGAPLRDAYHQAPRDTVSQLVYDGWKQYNLNCARCHGEDVLGTTIAPHLIVSLKPDGPINTKELFVQTVCAGRPAKGMPSWCALGLEMDKINQIYEYVHGRSAGKIAPGRPAVKQAG